MHSLKTCLSVAIEECHYFYKKAPLNGVCSVNARLVTQFTPKVYTMLFVNADTFITFYTTASVSCNLEKNVLFHK